MADPDLKYQQIIKCFWHYKDFILCWFDVLRQIIEFRRFKQSVVSVHLCPKREKEVTEGSLVYFSTSVTTLLPFLCSHFVWAGHEESSCNAHLLQANCGVEGQWWCLNRLLLTDVVTLTKIVGLTCVISGWHWQSMQVNVIIKLGITDWCWLTGSCHLPVKF